MSKDFPRQAWRDSKTVGDSWRKPRGRHSKMRKKWAGKGNHPGPGFGSPRSEKGKHPSGLFEVLVFTPAEVATVDPKTQCVRIGGTVGAKKRAEISKACEQKKVRLLNPPRVIKKTAAESKKTEKAEPKATKSA